MTWVKLDDMVTIHPKLLDAGAEAAWLWTSGLAHCNRYTTNGRIDKRHLASLYPNSEWSANQLKKLSKKLVDCRLWSDEGDFFLVHQYAEHQSEATKESVEARREREREKKRNQRERFQMSPGDKTGDNNRDKTGDTLVRPEHVPLPSPDQTSPTKRTTTTAARESFEPRLAQRAGIALAKAIVETGKPDLGIDPNTSALLEVAQLGESLRGSTELEAWLLTSARAYCAAKPTRSAAWWRDWIRGEATKGPKSSRPAYGRKSGWTAPASHEDFDREAALQPPAPWNREPAKGAA